MAKPTLQDALDHARTRTKARDCADALAWACTDLRTPLSVGQAGRIVLGQVLGVQSGGGEEVPTSADLRIAQRRMGFDNETALTRAMNLISSDA